MASFFLSHMTILFATVTGTSTSQTFLWSSKALAREQADVTAFWGSKYVDVGPSIVSPTYQYTLRRMYRTVFTILFGAKSTFENLEGIFDSSVNKENPKATAARRAEIPTPLIQFPAILPALLSIFSSAACASTVEGLSKVISSKSFAKGDQIECTKEFLSARSASASHIAEKGLAFLNNLYLESMEFKEILRGEGGLAQGVAAPGVPKWSKLPKSEELIEELTQIYYSGLCAHLAQQFRRPTENRTGSLKRGKLSANPGEAGLLGAKHRSPSNRRLVGSPTPTDACDGLSAEEKALREKDEKFSTPVICTRVLRLLVSISLDRLLHQNKGTHVIQNLLDSPPRDLYIFNPSPDFGMTMQVSTYKLFHFFLKDLVSNNTLLIGPVASSSSLHLSLSCPVHNILKSIL